MHSIQKVLLARLVSQNDRKYSSLTTGYNFDDNVVFHLKKLIQGGLIEKTDSVYKITPKGIKEIYSLGLPDLDNPESKLFYFGFVISDGNGNYLIKGHPSARVNFYNLPSDRPRFGEDNNQALVRLFYDNTGIKVEPKRFTFLSLHAKITKTKKGEVLFDDGQSIFKIEISTAEKQQMKLFKGIEWLSKNEIKKLPNCWPELKWCILDDNVLPYRSYEVFSDYKL